MEGLLRFRHNAINISTINTFQSIKGGINNNCKDVYFVRAIGTNAAYAEEIRKMDAALLGYMDSNKGYYCRISALPRLQSVEETAFYSACYSRWEDGGRQEILTRATQRNKTLAVMLSRACAVVEGLYTTQMGQATESIRKNLIIKMLFWYDNLFDREDFSWNDKSIVKIVAENIEKKQEYLFFYLVTMMGCDVLLLQSSKDIAKEEEKLGLSTTFFLGDFSQEGPPGYERHPASSGVLRRSEGYPAASAPHRPAGDHPASSTAVRNPGGQPDTPVIVRLPERQRPGRQAERTSEHRPLSAAGNAGTGSLAAVGGERAEKSFEELAQLASSVVLIFVHDQQGEIIGTGSGIMVGEEGYILTNNHVARGGQYYSVKIEDDEKEYKTDEIIKYHSVLDLALIRIERRLQPIPVYQGSKKLVRGQKVVAIGSPLGLFNSVSDGIISGFRVINDVDMIQFTAPTSHGSSGGAVLNMQGEVIGISTAGFSSGQNINLAMGYECINTFIRGFV